MEPWHKGLRLEFWAEIRSGIDSVFIEAFRPISDDARWNLSDGLPQEDLLSSCVSALRNQRVGGTTITVLPLGVPPVDPVLPLAPVAPVLP